MTTKVSLLSEPCSHHKITLKSVVLKRKCREIRQSPSMMWKRSIVQATTGCVTGWARAPAALALLLVVFVVSVRAASEVLCLARASATTFFVIVYICEQIMLT